MVGAFAPARQRRNRNFPKLGYHFGGPFNKDYSILVSILGSPYFGKLPNTFPYKHTISKGRNFLLCIGDCSVPMTNTAQARSCPTGTYWCRRAVSGGRCQLIPYTLNPKV